MGLDSNREPSIPTALAVSLLIVGSGFAGLKQSGIDLGDTREAVTRVVDPSANTSAPKPIKEKPESNKKE